jgi:two-component sensor histidine kinase
VAIRSALPLNPQQLPMLSIVVALAVLTTFVGTRAGIACAVAGGLASWYLFVNPRSWSVANGAWVPLIGFTVIAIVIISTAHLYRASERLHYRRELAELERQALTSRMFAGELSHRMKNALTIVQSIALQTMDPAAPGTTKFISRLKALAEANNLLSEHVSQPTANISNVIATATMPFSDEGTRFEISSVDVPIASQQAISLALALHELGTNAVKHGSLSRPEGRVIIRVEDGGDRLVLTWIERGGPSVTVPERTGFGTRLLQRAGIETRIDYDPAGLECTLALRKGEA